MTTSNNIPRYERPRATAEHLRIGLSTLWRWSKESPSFPEPKKIGKRVTLFDLNEIEQWMSTQRKASKCAS